MSRCWRCGRYIDYGTICDKCAVDETTTDCEDCEARIRAETVEEFATMLKEFVETTGTLPNHKNIELLQEKISKLKEKDNGKKFTKKCMQTNQFGTE